RRSITPNGQPATHVPQPLHTSSWTTTVPNSVRNNAPVGHTSKQPALVQCLHTSDDISHRKVSVYGGVVSTAAGVSSSLPLFGMPSETSLAPSSRALVIRSLSCSINATCRHVFAPSYPGLS